MHIRKLQYSNQPNELHARLLQGPLLWGFSPKRAGWVPRCGEFAAQSRDWEMKGLLVDWQSVCCANLPTLPDCVATQITMYVCTITPRRWGMRSMIRSYKTPFTIAKDPIVINNSPPLSAVARTPALSASPVAVAAGTVCVVTTPIWQFWSNSGQDVIVYTVVYALVGKLPPLVRVACHPMD